MSEFNDFAKKADAIIRDAFKEYRFAEKALEFATRAKDATPRRLGSGAEYEAKAARAEATYLDAKQGLQSAKRSMSAYSDRLAILRKELVEALDKAYCVNPARIDANVLELLKSGIVRPNEYARLYDEAANSDNVTMCRLIGKYAESAAGEFGNTPEGAKLRYIANNAKKLDGRQYLQSYDGIADTFRRCVNNPAMISRWDELTADVINEF